MLAALCQPGTAELALLPGLLLAGLAGSAMHCAPMCGPFVLGQVSDRLARVPVARLCEASRLRAALLLPYHAGRLTTYAALGAAAGVLGSLPARGPVAGVLLLLAALMFLVHAGGRVARPLRNVVPRLDRAPPALARIIGKAAHRIDRTHWTGGLTLGLALGLLPCGFLYAALAVAAASGGGSFGALAMLAFGAGTVPSLVAVGLAGRGLHRIVAAIAPALMLCNAALLAAMGVASFL
jgi:sulfite exporter TauE/SafE